jgi:hypothetical protein
MGSVEDKKYFSAQKASAKESWFEVSVRGETRVHVRPPFLCKSCKGIPSKYKGKGNVSVLKQSLRHEHVWG